MSKIETIFRLVWAVSVIGFLEYAFALALLDWFTNV